MSTAPGVAPTGATPLLQFRHLSKSFGGERALDDVELTIAPGEVHGLLGQNGSGKSTLIKVLAGYHAPEPGAELAINGEQVPLPLAVGGFRRYGVAFVHQHLGLIPSLSVTENLFCGELASRSLWAISWRRLRERAVNLFDEFGLAIEPDIDVRRLPPVQRALLAIVRAVLEMRETAGERHRGLLVLDEPTPFLPKHDVDQLFSLVRDIVATGASAIFVSHDVDEVMDITDRATVLRDGRRAGTLVTREATKQDFIEMIVGRRFELTAPSHPTFTRDEATIRIENLTCDTVPGLSLDLHRGEVVGLTGLIGAGFDDVPYALFGAAGTTSGRLQIPDRRIDLATLDPRSAIAAGIVLLPGDRQNSAAIGALSVTDNVTMAALGRYFRPWLLDRARMRTRTRDLAAEFEVRPNAPDARFEALSGGNQQKALLAKWMQSDPMLILLDEPTQGVDVGARQTVFKAIAEVAGRGATVVCASSDYEQLAAICDRVLVFSHGRVVSTLEGDAVTKDSIAEHCYQSLDSALRDPARQGTG
ncbi:MAG: sugar ABC transporter ATP-binding protein [Alphaproteobacteria bacterium]